MSSTKIVKTLLGIFTIIYCVSPVDLFPGPVDDFVVFILQTFIQMKLSDKSKKEAIE